MKRLHTVNEQYGRKFGDLVLRIIGISLKKLARRIGGIGCRQGGDVFLLCCPHQDDMELLLKGFLSEVFAEKELADRIELKFGVLTDAQKVKDVEERFALAGVAAVSVMEDTERICGFYSKE